MLSKVACSANLIRSAVRLTVVLPCKAGVHAPSRKRAEGKRLPWTSLDRAVPPLRLLLPELHAQDAVGHGPRALVRGDLQKASRGDVRAQL